jgi:hypothetical protein
VSVSFRVTAPCHIRHAALFLLPFLAVFLGSGRTNAGEPEEDPKPRVIDPGVAPGPMVTYTERPALSPDLKACSARVPVCVHTASSRDATAAMTTLAAFERMWPTMTQALDLPSPDLDPSTLAYDVFLDDNIPTLSSTHLEARDVRSRVDRGRAFSRIDRRFKAPSCVLDRSAAEAIARASLYRVAPSTEEGVAKAQAAYLALLAVPCALAFDETISIFQSRTERTFADGRAGDDHASPGVPPSANPYAAQFARGASAFWARLDWAYGRKPGVIVPAAWALHPTMTPVPAHHWVNEPDTFDVLRMTFKGALSTNSTVHDLWLDFGIARAFCGSADDGFHLPELRTLEDTARITPDWDVPWPEKPRRLAGRHPVHPLGAAYLIVHSPKSNKHRLRAEMEWEEHALFRWAFVKLDERGKELGRVVIPTTERATQAAMTLVDLENVDRIMLVGVNVGDPAYAFDPDDEVWEPHGFLVTIAEEP